MQLKPFRIERYDAQHEFSTRDMLSSSDCESRTIARAAGVRARRSLRRAAGRRVAGEHLLVEPGSVYDVPDNVRVGFGRANLPQAPDVLETTRTAA